MVIARIGGRTQQQQQLASQSCISLGRANESSSSSNNGLKVPCLIPHEQEQGAFACKRKWQDGFQHQEETVLRLACGSQQEHEQEQQQQKKPKCSTLTVFYAGTLCSFDNVPEETARALMELAASSSFKIPAPVTDLDRFTNNVNGSNKMSSSNNFMNNNMNSGSSNKFVNNNMYSGSSNNFMSSSNVNNCTNKNMNSSSSSFVSHTNKSCNLNIPNSSSTSTAAAATAAAAAKTAGATTSGGASNTGFSFPTVLTEQKGEKTNNSSCSNTSSGFSIQVMQSLPGLPQARRASIQRFLERRKHK